MQSGGVGVHSGLMRIRHLDLAPSVHPEAYVATTAVLSGDVRVGRGSCIMHGAVLAAEGGTVDVGANCVIMENAVLRGTPRHPLIMGDHVLAGPHSHLTGCGIADEVFIATGARVFNGAQMGRASSVALGGQHRAVHDAAAAADADVAAEHRGGRHVGLGVDGRSHVQVSYHHQPTVHPARPDCTPHKCRNARRAE